MTETGRIAAEGAISKWHGERRSCDPATVGRLYFAMTLWRARSDEDGHYVYPMHQPGPSTALQKAAVTETAPFQYELSPVGA